VKGRKVVVMDYYLKCTSDRSTESFEKVQCGSGRGYGHERQVNPSIASLSVIIPVFNEESTIKIIVKKVSRLRNLKEVIVVDDGSSDSTSERVEKLALPKVRLIRQKRNAGKTAAVRRGLQEVSGDITIFQDADLEYDPDEIEDVIRPIRENKADVVYGSRFLVKRATRVLYFYHYLANKMITLFSNVLTNVNMTDIETCYKAFRTPLITNLPLTSSGFGMEVEITALISKTKARIYEVPISYYGRTYEEGKKIKFIDGLVALWYISYFNLIYNISPSRRKYIEKANTFLAQWKREESNETMPANKGNF
jgi:glycosyltransferase involved in cell wall biosynthesis